MVDFLTEIMPAEVRIFGFSLACSLAPAVFGGFTPAFIHRIEVTGNPALPRHWCSPGAACRFVVALRARQGRKSG